MRWQLDDAPSSALIRGHCRDPLGRKRFGRLEARLEPMPAGAAVVSQHGA
jgi:hypothetical protein